ncbi:MAG TPA: hypothetical protein VNO30_19865 [Kofleriaceae bacterium]|nr:hypothetical protein [Kofleriaceae bacterium]
MTRQRFKSRLGALGALARRSARFAALPVVLLVALCGALVAGAPDADAAPALSHAARAGRITVLAEPGLGRAARQLADSAETALARIASDLVDLPAPRAIEVRLVEDARDLAAVAPAGRGAPAWAVGVAYPDLGVISVAVRRGPEMLDAAATLRHELAHIALGVALGPRVPRWLHEGFAYQHSSEWSWARMETLAGMSWLGGIIPLAELERSFPREELPAHRAYAESYDFVGFLARRGRYEDREDDGDRWPFRRFLAAIAHGHDVDTAAQLEFDRPLARLFDEWRASLSQRYLLMPVGLLGLAVWCLIAVLLVLAWRKRRQQNRMRLAVWEAEEAARAQKAREQAAAALIVPPPYVAWPGQPDPLDDPDEDQRKPDPELLN